MLGAGVAGLQAIATCKRLGAVVKAYDVRAAAAEEIRSMGAVAIELELETLEGAGGYAREMTEDRADSPARAADAVHRSRRRADHDGSGAGPAGADAGDGGDGRADEARISGRRPGRGVWRQRRGLAARRRRRRSGTRRSGAGSTCRARCPARPVGCTRRTSSTSSTLMTAEGAFAPDFSDEIVSSMAVTHRGRDHPRTNEAGPGGRAWMSPLSG